MILVSVYLSGRAEKNRSAEDRKPISVTTVKVVNLDNISKCSTQYQYNIILKSRLLSTIHFASLSSSLIYCDGLKPNRWVPRWYLGHETRRTDRDVWAALRPPPNFSYTLLWTALRAYISSSSPIAYFFIKYKLSIPVR
jgi:hypothetical protein